jgi:hypothetical protein
MLTPEEMARIEEEEQKRQAEEQYRAQVRSRLQAAPQMASGLKASTLNAGDRLFALKLTGVAALIITGIAIAVNLIPRAMSGSSTSKEPFSPSIIYETKAEQIASGQIAVQNGGAVFYQFTITRDMSNPVVRGSFTASGGSGNDIAAVIANEEEYSNWINGHEAKVYWTTQGKKTAGSFEVRPPPGKYYRICLPV